MRAERRLTEVTHNDPLWDCKYNNFFSNNKIYDKSI